LIVSTGLGATAFEKSLVVEGPGTQSYPAVWGNYVVWSGAQGQAYDIAARALMAMPGLNIEGAPAIWEHRVVWPGVTGYYDLEARAFIELPGLSVGENPALYGDKIVWSESGGYYDVALRQMVYPAGLAVGSDPDIWEDKLVWSDSEGYYDLGRAEMVYPEGVHIGAAPAIHDNKVIWRYAGSYYDLTTQSYAGPPAGNRTAPDVFGGRYVYVPYDGVPPVVHDVYVWDPCCGFERLSDSGAAGSPAIYADVVVWVERGQVGPDGSAGYSAIYMARLLGCCGDAAHPYPVGDLNRDCRVDLADLAILLSHWLESTDPACD
jgi:hypothetical protein